MPRRNTIPTPRSRARPPTLAQAIGEMLETRRAGFQKELGRVAHEWTADSIHDLRVACRRYRSALRAFLPFLDEAAGRTLATALKEFMRAFNDLRDLDVQLELLAELPPAERPTVRRAVAGLVNLFRARKQRLDEELKEFVRTHGRVGTLPLPAPRPEPLPTLAEGVRAVLAAELQEAVARARAIAWDLPETTVEPLHDLRIQFKRLRYAVELFAPFLGQEAPGLLKVCKHVQDLLGWIHDLDALAAALTRLWRQQIRERERLARRLVRDLPWPFPPEFDPEPRFHPAPRDHRKAFLYLLHHLSRQRDRHYQTARQLLAHLETLQWADSLATWFARGTCPTIWKKEFARHA